MKRSVKKLIIISATLLLIGAVIAGIALYLMSFRFDGLNLEAQEYIEDSIEITEEFEDIDITVSSCDIRFEHSNDRECRVDYAGDTGYDYNAYAEGNTLYITCGEKPMSRIVMFNVGCRMTVFLPDRAYDDITIETSSGDIDITEGLDIKNVSVNGSSGEIFCACSVKNGFTANSSSGDVELDNVSCEKIDVTMTSGEINLLDCDADEVLINTTSGDVEFENVICGKIDITATSGEINLLDCDADEILINTTSGDVSGTLLSAKRFDVSTSSGDINVPHTDSDELCSIKTTSGDVNIKIKE